MSSKKSIPFEFPHTFRKPVLRGGKMTHDKLTVIIRGYGYASPHAIESCDTFSADIDYITYEGTDVKPVLEFFELMDEAQDAAISHVSEQFKQSEKEGSRHAA